MKCPICVTVDLNLAERQGVEIDYCPECRGVWLDRGELDKILERSHSAQPVQPPRQEQRSYDQHSPVDHSDSRHHDSHSYGHQGQHKRKSWLSEIFD